MPLSINQIPIPVPSSTDPANFSARGDAVFGAFPDFITETNAVASEAAANRDLAEASKTAAANSETNAATYAANATTSANNASSSSVASLWVSGTTYAINDKRVSPITGQVYRRKTAGAGTTDPSLDSTNWYAVLLDADTQYPSIKPTLNLDFANSGKLDPRITFTRASTATYYDGKTFAKAEENLLTYSQEFDNASTFVSGVTKTANVAAAPDGTMTADRLFGYESSWYTQQEPSLVAGARYTISVYVMSNNGSSQLFRLYGSSFTPSEDLVATTSWQRFSFTFTATTSFGCGITRQSAGGVNDLLIWGFQLEQRDQATAYTPTTSQPITKYQPVLKTASNNEPRFDYDPVTLESKGLLIEEQRTNLLTYSEQFDNAVWGKAAVTVTSNAIISPDGNLTADKLIATTTNGEHYVEQYHSFATNQTYTVTVYAKADAAVTNFAISTVALGSSAAVSYWFIQNNMGVLSSLSTSGLIVSTSITPVGNDWYRLNMVYSLNGTVESHRTRIYVLTQSNDGAAHGDGFSGIYIWGAQLEAGSFPTSYIPTTTTAVTRQSDNAVMTGSNFSSWYNQGEGTFYAEGTTTNVCVPLQADDETSNNYISGRFRLNGVSGASAIVLSGGVTQASFSSTFSTVNKLSLAYSANNFAASLNGNDASLDSSGVVPTVNRLRLGANENATFGGTIKKITYYPKRLPNYQLQILTK